MMSKEYFSSHAVMEVELGLSNKGIVKKQILLKDIGKYCDKAIERGSYINYVIYSTVQPDEWVRKILNTAYYNWNKNKEWVEKKGIKSINELVGWIIENKRID